MKIRRVMLAAPKSGSGKTMLTCALLQTLKDRGNRLYRINAVRTISTRCFIRK